MGRSRALRKVETMADNWNISWHHEALGIPDLWRQDIVGRDVTVALLDTGLAAPAGLDRRDFLYLRSDGAPIGPTDTYGHGTCCASIIAGYLGGALGIAPFASIVSMQVLETGTTIEDVESALQYVLGRPEIDVVSCSFVLSMLTPKVRDAVRALTNAGKLVIAAAGDNQDVASEFPEQTPNAVTVAAVDATSAPLPHARMGAWIDVAAPGFDIPVVTADGNIATFGESSAAAAVVSGVAALVLSTLPRGERRRSVARGLEGLFKATARSIAGSDPSAIGCGVVNPAALVKAAQSLVANS